MGRTILVPIIAIVVVVVVVVVAVVVVIELPRHRNNIHLVLR